MYPFFIVFLLKIVKCPFYLIFDSCSIYYLATEKFLILKKNIKN